MFMTILLAASLHCPDGSGGVWLRNCDPNRDGYSSHAPQTAGPVHPDKPTGHVPGGPPRGGGTPSGTPTPGGDPETPGGDPGGCKANCGPGDPGTPPGKKGRNNGWGNGDQDAPGNSGNHNNAENNHTGKANPSHGKNSH